MIRMGKSHMGQNRLCCIICISDELARAAAGYHQAKAMTGDRGNETQRLKQENMRLSRELRSCKGIFNRLYNKFVTYLKMNDASIFAGFCNYWPQRKCVYFNLRIT